MARRFLPDIPLVIVSLPATKDGSIGKSVKLHFDVYLWAVADGSRNILLVSVEWVRRWSSGVNHPLWHVLDVD
jgi:hypothetical protein